MLASRDRASGRRFSRMRSRDASAERVRASETSQIVHQSLGSESSCRQAACTTPASPAKGWTVPGKSKLNMELTRLSINLIFFGCLRATCRQSCVPTNAATGRSHWWAHGSRERLRSPASPSTATTTVRLKTLTRCSERVAIPWFSRRPRHGRHPRRDSERAESALLLASRLG